MASLRSFTHAKPRPLPVILLADTSGSMAGQGKIAALNQSIREMLATFAKEEDGRAQIHVAVITFGGVASHHIPLTPAADAQWSDMQASGGTPMGAAFTLVQQLIEDRDQIPSRAYRPTIVLVSDGAPTDAWQQALEALRSGRSAKAFRMALAIGADAQVPMLRQFVGGEEPVVYKTEDAGRIRDFFDFVTMSVTSRTQSANPNAVSQVASPTDLDF